MSWRWTRACLIALGVAAAPPAALARSPKPKPAPAKVEPAPAPAPAPRVPGPDDAAAVAALEKIVAGPDAAARRAAIDELGKLAPRAVEAIGEWIVRPHEHDLAARRAVLASINAAVPDKSGRFAPPPRQTNKERKADDEVDWLPALLEADPGLPGLGEVIADVAAIRALSATSDIRAAQLVFDVAFVADTMIYRDECGRFIRKMHAYSIPALTRESQGKSGDRRRYATWQLERLDRQDPAKALGAAVGNEALVLAILDAFRTTKLREAVGAVWSKVDDDAPRVRAAARATWMVYITGPAPPPAPKKHLVLPGGKKTKEPKPMWLTYRELADTELRRAANTLLHEDYAILDETDFDDKKRKIRVEKIDLVEVTERLFAYYDGERAKQDAERWAAAKARADAGDLAAAVTMLDHLIATNPERAERAEMAKVYAARGKQLADEQHWPEASAAYSKAHGLDPDGAGAKEALAAHHFALGKALEAQGKDGGPDFRKAMAIAPASQQARAAAAQPAAGGDAARPVWMLYAALGAGGLSMLLLGAALLRRRAEAGGR